MHLTRSRGSKFALGFSPVNKMTKQEQWVLLAFLLLVVTGLAGKVWLARHPSAALPPLPGSPAPEPVR
jgi:hypothetical protein